MDSNSAGVGTVLGARVRTGPGLRLGHYSVVGNDGPVEIGAGVRIGSYCLVEAGASIGNRVTIDSYCWIAEKVAVGEESQILYGAQLFARARVGERCVVGGSLIDDAVLGNDVTYMGHMAHSYRHPGDLNAWDEVVQQSISVGDNSVIGERALLIGGIEVGARSYIAAGEVVRCDVPADTVLIRGKFVPMRRFRGLIRARS